MGEEPMSTTPQTERTPEEIRRDIEATRADMDQTMDQLETRVSPTRIKERQTAKLRGRWSRVRESIMGSAQQARDSVTGTAEQVHDSVTPSSGGGASATDRVREQGHQAAEAVKDAPDRAKAQTRGNPLAAGTVAFGLGALVGSLLPSSEAEQQAAGKLRQEAEEPVKQKLKQAGQQSKEDLQPAVQDAAQQTKQRATDAAQNTKDEAQDRAQNVQQRAQEGADRAKKS